MIELLINFILLLWLTSVASVATAMVISFFIKTPSAAKAILPFIIILQILMGGSRIRPLIDMEGVVYDFSKVMTSRWGFEPAAMLFETHLNNEEGTESILYRVSGNNYYKLQKREFSDIQDILRLVMLMNAVNSDKPEECVNTLRQVFKEGNAFKEVNTFIKLLNDIPIKRLIELKATAFRIALFREFYSKISDDKTKLTTKELITRIYNNFDEDLKRLDVKKIFNNLVENKEVYKHKEVWNWMVNVNPKIELFRPIHVSSAWFALFIISVSMLVLLRILFWLRR